MQLFDDIFSSSKLNSQKFSLVNRIFKRKLPSSHLRDTNFVQYPSTNCVSQLQSPKLDVSTQNTCQNHKGHNTYRTSTHLKSNSFIVLLLVRKSYNQSRKVWTKIISLYRKSTEKFIGKTLMNLDVDWGYCWCQ